MNPDFLPRKNRWIVVFSVFLLISGCHAAGTNFISLDPSLYYVARGESSLRNHSLGEARHSARKKAVVSLVSIISTHVMEVRSRTLVDRGRKAEDASSSVVVSSLDLRGKVHFSEEKKGHRFLVLAYLAKTDVPGNPALVTHGPERMAPGRVPLQVQGSETWVTGKGFANLSEYGVADAREMAMRRAMKEALLNGSLLFQGTVSAQNVQIGQIHERSLFMKNAFDILEMNVDVLPEIHKEIEGFHVRLLAVRVRLHLRARSSSGPALHVRLDHPYYTNGQVAHLIFRLKPRLYLAVFDRYGTSGSVVGILPTKETLPDNPSYRSAGKSFETISPGTFTYPPEDPRIDLVAQLPAGVTRVSEEYLVVIASTRPLPLLPRYEEGSLYYELDGESFRTLMARMAKRPLSEWSMKTIPFIVYGNVAHH